jgi:hypothetical protein
MKNNEKHLKQDKQLIKDGYIFVPYIPIVSKVIVYDKDGTHEYKQKNHKMFIFKIHLSMLINQFLKKIFD